MSPPPPVAWTALPSYSTGQISTQLIHSPGLGDFTFQATFLMTGNGQGEAQNAAYFGAGTLGQAHAEYEWGMQGATDQVPALSGFSGMDPVTADWTCTNNPQGPSCSTVSWYPAITSCWRPNYYYCSHYALPAALPLNTPTTLRLARCGASVVVYVNGVAQITYSGAGRSVWQTPTPAGSRLSMTI